MNRDREKPCKSKSRSLLFASILLALCFPVEAQQPGKLPRIGFVLASGPEGPALPPASGKGCEGLGYIEGKNIVVEHRYAEGIEDRPPGSRRPARATKS